MKKNLFSFLAITMMIATSIKAQTVTTFASTSYPYGIAFNSTGNLYVCSAVYYDNAPISKITRGGVVSTFASGFDSPIALAFDSSGNLYVANKDPSQNGIISKVTPSGVVSTFVSSGLTGYGSANEPYGLAFDRMGNLYFPSFVGNNTITKVTPSGVVSTFASGLHSPGALAFDASGDLYVASNSGIISKITPSGVVSTFASGFSFPQGLAFDSSGNLYVANNGANTISKVTSSGVVSTFVSSGLNGPSGLAFDTSDNLYVANSGSNTISKIIMPSPTPVTIAALTATAENNTIQTNWHTATELNTSHFIIQHSTDGTSFTDIGTVKAIGSGANSYSFTDSHPADGINYYRLESVDKDGGASYSKVVSVQFTVNSNQLTVYPNPSRDNVTIKGSHIASVQVIDNLGRVVKIVSLKDATNPTLSVSSLPAGVYHLRIQTSDGSVSSATLMVKD